MLLLDIEKEYDRVEWPFLKTTLEAFGFPPMFCGMVDTLLEDVVAQFDVNRSHIEVFELERSIRQGFPLAPDLFVIAFDALHHLLREHSQSPRVRGIKLPDQNYLITIQFSDDTKIFIELEENNMEDLMGKLNTFCYAYGAKISIAKSSIIGWTKTPSKWIKKYDF